MLVIDVSFNGKIGYDSSGNFNQTHCIMEDITERNKARDELLRKTTQLEHSNEELENFAYIASHDLREPLHKIQIFSDMILKSQKKDFDEKSADYLSKIQKSAKRMSEMIENLLTLSRIRTSSATFIKTDLNLIVHDVISDLSVTIDELKAQIIIEKLPVIYGDPSQISRLFLNLLSNSLKYHQNDTAPKISIKSDINEAESNSESSEIRGSSVSNGENFCKIYVKDNGIGFDAEYVGRIFKPFHRLYGKSAYEGTGIGLAICYRIVERHGGAITANSKSGKGTTMILTLPVRQLK